MNIKISSQTHTNLKILAASSNKKLQEVVENALSAYLDQKNAADEVIEIKK